MQTYETYTIKTVHGELGVVEVLCCHVPQRGHWHIVKGTSVFCLSERPLHDGIDLSSLVDIDMFCGDKPVVDLADLEWSVSPMEWW